MQAVYGIPDLRSARASLSGTFGLVPTMGALHEGHLSLVQRAKEECDRVGVSIFVNPAQFGADEDLDRYPRDPDHDLKLLETLGADLVWIPAPETVYPPLYQTWITVEEVSKGLEGRQRPGHFRGVATVVAKLFNLFLPDRAYFGQKDAQQVVVVKRMAADLNFPVEIVVCPTVRAPDGLALSSRNRYLSPEQRRAATVLHRALTSAAAAYGNGERSSSRLCAAMMAILDTEPLARAEYVSAADPETLVEADRLASGALLSLAVRIGNVRLIDNFVIPSGDTYAARY
jgi:pantoate--beta-alanine ligase